MLSKSNKTAIRDSLNSDFPFRDIQINMLCNLFLTVSKQVNLIFFFYECIKI